MMSNRWRGRVKSGGSSINDARKTCHQIPDRTSGSTWRCIKQLYCSWLHCWWLKHGLQLVVVAHADFRGVTLAIHLLAYHRMDASCVGPKGALAQTLAHVINLSLLGSASKIEPPKLIKPPIPCAPIVQGEILHGKGLFKITP
jgi:hypothetical protein